MNACSDTYENNATQGEHFVGKQQERKRSHLAMPHNVSISILSTDCGGSRGASDLCCTDGTPIFFNSEPMTWLTAQRMDKDE